MTENVPKAMNPEFHECVNPAQQLGVVFYCFYKVCAEELPFGMDFISEPDGLSVSRTVQFEILIKIVPWVVYL